MATLHAAVQNDPILRAAARDMECRSRTCRMEIADDGTGKVSEELALFAQAVMTHLPNIQADHSDDGRGGATYVLYLTHDEPIQRSAAR